MDKTGLWLEKHDDSWVGDWFIECSICGEAGMQSMSPFCHWCGAKMENAQFEPSEPVEKEEVKPIKLNDPFNLYEIMSVMGLTAEQALEMEKVFKDGKYPF